MSTAINATGLISTTCTYGTNYALSLNVGQGAGATFSTRRMTGSSGTLGYNLYRDSTRTQAWGDGSAGSTTVSSTGNGTVQTSTVYATLPVQALPRPGAYADTITVTVTY
jgi:spore coat protein U-like protein